jgi:CRISPR/Cas system CMR subunit Cmr6 (Cas7 group RAMP superfamily)
MRCVRDVELRTRCKMLTWQELAEVLPERLREYLAEKYGIGARAFAAEAD